MIACVSCKHIHCRPEHGAPFLASYHHAVLSVVLAQFGPKGFQDGMEGIVKLVEALPYLKVTTIAFT